jgi:hypothetical protein
MFVSNQTGEGKGSEVKCDEVRRGEGERERGREGEKEIGREGGKGEW